MATKAKKKKGRITAQPGPSLPGGFSPGLHLADVARTVCRAYYYEFVREFWDELAPGTDAVWNWHIEMMCNDLQDISERVFRKEKRQYDLIYNVPPGSTKSTTFSVGHCPWTWTRNPYMRHIVGSYAQLLSYDLSRKARDVVLSDKYRAYFPEIALRQDQNNKSYFQNTKGGYRFATSVGGSVTGFHAHFLGVDDPMDPNAAISETEANLTASNNWLSETLPSRKVDQRVSVTWLVMQRLHQNDGTGNRLEKKDKVPVLHRSLPADISEGYEVLPKEWEKYYEDGLLDPERINREVLGEKRVVLGEFAYAGQYGQSPVPRSGGMFKTDRLNYVDALPGQVLRVCRYWDKAGTKDAGCYTAGVLLGVVPIAANLMRFYVLDVKRFREEAAARERLIKVCAANDLKDWGHKLITGIEQEPGSGGKDSARYTVQNLAGFRVFLEKVTGDKIDRAEPFAAQVNEGNVYVLNRPWTPAYVGEMQYYGPSGTYKDQIDASSGAFNHLTRGGKRIGTF